MELTPEEKARIYEEEKQRLEAREALKAQDTARKRGGCLKLFAYVIVGFIGLAILGQLSRGCSSTGSERSSGVTSAPKALNPSEMAQLEKNFKALMAAGVVRTLDTSAYPPRIMVGRMFYALTYEQKVAAAKVISDYWAAVGGKSGGAARFDLCDAYTGERLYTWDYIELKR